MKELYKINEIAKMYNVSTDTLRFYDRIGLLSPWETGENGYRYYSKAQFEIISTIMLLRAMGTPIRDLKEILDGRSAEAIRSELNRQILDMDKEIERLLELRDRAGNLMGEIDRIDADSIGVEVVPKLWVFSKRFGDEDELDIEEILKVNRHAGKDWVSFAGIMSTITVEKLNEGDFHTYDRYGYISEQPCNFESPYLDIIPERKCVVGISKVCSPEHAEIDETYKRMLDYISQRKLDIAGDAIERNILDLYAGDSKNPTMFFKIYIPVR